MEIQIDNTNELLTNYKWQRKLRAAIRFFTHPRSGVVLALIALGIGVIFFLAAPVLLPTAAPVLATITLIGFSWAAISLFPYFSRFITGLWIDTKAFNMKDQSRQINFLGALGLRAIQWAQRHPAQLAVVLFGIAGLAVTLFFTISFFTGGIGALVIPAILAPLGLAPAIPLLLFNLLPLALANIMKGIMAEITSKEIVENGFEKDPTLLAWECFDAINDKTTYDNKTPLRSAMITQANLEAPILQQIGGTLFFGKPKLHDAKPPAYTPPSNASYTYNNNGYLPTTINTVPCSPSQMLSATYIPVVPK